MLNKVLKLRETIANLKLPHFLQPIDSARQLTLWFLVYGGTAFVAANLIDFLKGVSVPVLEGTIGNILMALFIGVVLPAIGEEAAFRGIFKVALGNTGLIIGTLIWIGLHQTNAIPPPLTRIPTDILLGVFLIKLWRGKYSWFSFIIHPLWNVAIILSWQVFFPVLTSG